MVSNRSDGTSLRWQERGHPHVPHGDLPENSLFAAIALGTKRCAFQHLPVVIGRLMRGQAGALVDERLRQTTVEGVASRIGVTKARFLSGSMTIATGSHHGTERSERPLSTAGRNCTDRTLDAASDDIRTVVLRHMLYRVVISVTRGWSTRRRAFAMICRVARQADWGSIEPAAVPVSLATVHRSKR
jgi:hypothetical protein